MEIIAILTFLLSISGAICAIVLPIVILAGFGYFLYRRSKMRDDARLAAKDWSSTMGVITMSTIQIKRTNRSRSEVPVVMYQYQVSGNPYTGRRIKAGEQYFNVNLMGDAQKTIARYPVGAEVMVYYDPADPRESALER